MTYDMHSQPPLVPTGRVLLTPADLAEAVDELESLRSAHRAALADDLRDARTYGSPGDDDDHLAVLEDAAFAGMRIAQLERLVDSATVVEFAVDGVVGLGSVVRVRDESGRESEYEIVGRRVADAKRTQVTPASPVGEALLGARSGDRVRVLLPSERRRTLMVLAVASPGHDQPPDRATS